MGVVISGGGEEEDDTTWARVGLAPLMATLLLPIIIGVVVLIKCVFNSCCARTRTTTKEEMYGLEGRMTMLPNNELHDASTYHQPLQRERSSSPSLTTPSASLLGTYLSDCNPDKVQLPNKLLINNNNAPPVASSPINDLTTVLVESSHIHHANVDSDHTDTLKRATGKRQLPDLPQIPQSLHPPRRSSSVLSHDTTSELYATVGDVPNSVSKSGISNSYAHLARRQLEDQMSAKPSTSRGITTDVEGPSGIKGKGKSGMEMTLPSSDSETYATTSNHPYAKVKRNPSEHPYARVRNSSLGNDEETDTDNYDIPQPYAQTRRPTAGTTTSNQNQPISNQPSTSSSGSVPANAEPVPPRRIGRQWRRGSHPQGQGQIDTTTHFSGDSQDSRGYTSISVREPLSNIRNQISSARQMDSHYATVSDDSEEMYAAIDDSSEGNYMQISEGERPRPSWLDQMNVTERREANSPLPPVPAVPPPETPGEIAGSGLAPTSPTLAVQNSQTPPVYAQVTKKPKKGKAPVTPTASNASTSSQAHLRENTDILSSSEQGPSNVGVSSTSPTTPGSHQSSSVGGHSHSSTSTHHHHHHRSKSRTLMDNSNLLEANLSENRRWSKADISYSEFEVVREGFPPEPKKSPKVPTIALDRTPVSPRNSLTTSVTEELVDEDNYNLIADNRDHDRLSRESKRSSRGGRSKRRSGVDSDNYQEIDHLSNNTYQEIGGGKEPSDHYQEIGAGSSFNVVTNGGMDDDDDEPNPLYQVIRKKEDDYEDEEDDEFYEKVKPSVPAKSTLSVTYSKDRKHGYEKLKRKGRGHSSPKRKSASDEEDEEDEDGKGDGDEMYERVKYPPYERLKESRSDLAMDDIAADDDESSNFYEHIGYSRVKPRGQRETKDPTAKTEVNHIENHDEGDGDTGDVDVNQLYAVVDKSKKKNKNLTVSSNSQENNSNNNHAHASTRESNLKSPTPSATRSTPTKRADAGTPKHTLSSLSGGVDLEYIDDSIDIEYI